MKTIDSEYEQIKKDVIGARITDVFRSEEWQGEWFEGLGYPVYFDIVLKLDNGNYYHLNEDGLWAWPEKGTLSTLENARINNDFSLEFLNKSIRELRMDGEYLILENDVVIDCFYFHSTTLSIDKYSNTFDEKGELI